MYDAELSVQREDDEDEFTGLPYSKWTTKKASPGETRAVFVDEFTCIGCKQCVWRRRPPSAWMTTTAARASSRSGSTPRKKSTAPSRAVRWIAFIGCKRSNCRTWSVVQFVDKVSVGIMQSGQGRQSVTDPFDAAYAYQKFRERKIESRRAKLEEERRNREWRAQREAEKEGRRAAMTPLSGPRDPRAYRGAADKIRRVWSEGTGVKIDDMKRRRWADSGATVPWSDRSSRWSERCDGLAREKRASDETEQTTRGERALYQHEVSVLLHVPRSFEVRERMDDALRTPSAGERTVDRRTRRRASRHSKTRATLRGRWRVVEICDIPIHNILSHCDLDLIPTYFGIMSNTLVRPTLPSQTHLRGPGHRAGPSLTRWA